MMRRTFPWTMLLIALVAGIIGGGTMVHLSKVQTRLNEELEQQVREATARVSALRAREAKLKEQEAFRKEVDSRLLDPSKGQVEGQMFMAVVQAARSASVTLSEIQFSSDESDSVGATLSFTAKGSEVQVLRFLGLVEKGSPLAQVREVQWGIPVRRGVETAGGTVTLQIRIYGEAQR